MMVEGETWASYVQFLSALIANNHRSNTDVVVRGILKQSNAEQMLLIMISQS